MKALAQEQAILVELKEQLARETDPIFRAMLKEQIKQAKRYIANLS